jgi:hypothetical protein
VKGAVVGKRAEGCREVGIERRFLVAEDGGREERGRPDEAG